MNMTPACVLLSLVGVLGAIDIAWFHTIKGRLTTRPECRREAAIHIARGFVYALQFTLVPNVRFSGAWFIALVALFAVDIAIAVADVLEEPRSRAKQGGLSGGEYLMHIVLSVLVGAFLYALFQAATPWLFEPTALSFEPHAPDWLRGWMLLMALGAASVSVIEALVVLEQSKPPAEPLHVRVRLDAPLERVWSVTQDHRIHPGWDHRFDRILMEHEEGSPWDGVAGTPDPRIASGTLMRYEKRVGFATIRGFGRYKLHRPMRQSTFEFWSDDALSLIHRGVGLWLYTPLADGRVEFSTSFTYSVRWGSMGRVIDRYLFRPLFQRYTEQSFRRLARLHFAAPRAVVLGAAGRKPARFAREVEAVRT